MKKLRPLGRSQLLVSPMGLGCWQFSAGKGLIGGFWEALSQERVTSIVQASLAGGINWFDTAEAYGNGASEEALSTALAALGKGPGDVVGGHKMAALPQASLPYQAEHRRTTGEAGGLPHRPSPDPQPPLLLRDSGRDGGHGRPGRGGEDPDRGSQQLLSPDDAEGPHGARSQGNSPGLEPDPLLSPAAKGRVKRGHGCSQRAGYHHHRLLSLGPGDSHRKAPRGPNVDQDQARPPEANAGVQGQGPGTHTSPGGGIEKSREKPTEQPPAKWL